MISLLLVCRVPIPNLDQPNHLFLWACSQATECSWRKLALKQIYNFQAQLDCQCCSAILLLTHDWFPSPLSITAVPIFYPFSSELQTTFSPFMCTFNSYLLSTYYIPGTFLGVCRSLKIITNSLKLLSAERRCLFLFCCIWSDLLSDFLWPIDCSRNNVALLSNEVSRIPVTSSHPLGTLRPPCSEKP